MNVPDLPHPLMHLLPTGDPLPKEIEELSELFTEVLSRIVPAPYEEVRDPWGWDPEETRKIVAADPRQALWAMAQATGRYILDGEDERGERDEVYDLLEALNAPLGVLQFQGRVEPFIRRSKFSDRIDIFSKAPRDWTFPTKDRRYPSQAIRLISAGSIETWKALRLVSRHFLTSVTPYEEMFHAHAFIARRKLGGGMEEYKPSFRIGRSVYRAPLPRSLGRRPSEVLFIEEDEVDLGGPECPEVSLTYEDGLVVSTGWRFHVSRVMGVPVGIADLPVSESDLVFSPTIPFRKAVSRFYPPGLRVINIRPKDEEPEPDKLYSHRVMSYNYIRALIFFRSLRGPTIELARVRYSKPAHPEVVRAAEVFYGRLRRHGPPEPEFYDQINPYDLIRVGARDVKTREELMSLIKPRHRYLTIVGVPGVPMGLLKPKRFRKLMANLEGTGVRRVTVENQPEGFTFASALWKPYGSGLGWAKRKGV